MALTSSILIYYLKIVFNMKRFLLKVNFIVYPGPQSHNQPEVEPIIPKLTELQTLPFFEHPYIPMHQAYPS